jgi:Ubiquitin-2 like Rad60 SUMO-like
VKETHASVKYLAFDGDRLDDDELVESLDIEAGDMIDAAV